MALNSATFSGKQFQVYLASETTTGTFSTVDANFSRIDVEGITLPTFNPTQEFEMRTGAGRIAEFDQIFSSTKRVMTEFTLSGRLTQEMWKILMENAVGDKFDGGATFTDATCDYNDDPTISMDSTAEITVGASVTGTGIPANSIVGSITNSTTFELAAAADGSAVSTTGGAVTNGTLTFSSDSVLTIGSSYLGSSIKVGDDPTTSDDYTKLLSVYFAAPTASDSYSMKSCICTNFSIDGDMDSAAGRLNYSATFQTQSTPEKGEQAGLIAASKAIGSNTVFLSLLDDKNIDIKDYASDGTTDQDNITPLFKTFNMAIDNPTQFLGATGANGEPEVWGKALPELSITWGGSIKYDTETDNMVEAFRDPSGSSYLTFYLADVAVAGTTETPTGVFFGASSVNKLGMWFGQSKLTSCEVSSDDVAMVNFECKVLAPSSGNTAHFLGGDNV